MGLSKTQGGMGFRDLVCFNKALLAKQIWRLWKAPENLIAQIMKAKYYPNSTVLDAPLGNRPSFAWRSIQGASDLVKDGLVWRVGNGKSIHIWKDKWLPRPPMYTVYSPPLLFDPNATNISNAEKHFLWRACHESLPTKANLCNRKVTRDPICPVCEREAETTFHVLWQCPAAQDTWSAGCRKFQKSCFEGPFFLPVVEGMLRVCGQQEFALFAGIARRLWLRRNALIHEGDFLHPNILVQQAT
ncbi:uncharacterized protein LOC132178237 [Corylus avellana]|uniref:uncharacterized protein LOC132178237 n=1 Tax=Corylus avellana TaxID=13451 RepID=UPI00286AE985|nr:uncharacterized protein LOC132178237 [Corylus avellana]